LVLVCAKRPSICFCSLAGRRSGAPVDIYLSPPQMYFALYGLQMDVWNTLFTLLGSTLVIFAAKFISTVYLLCVRLFLGVRPTDPSPVAIVN